MTDYPFRQLKRDTIITRTMVQLLLAMPETTWTEQDYALFFHLGGIKQKNPTRRQAMVLLAVWLRFLKRLIESLPEGSDLRVNTLAEFYKVSANYQGLLEAKTA